MGSRLTLTSRYSDFWTLNERALDYALPRMLDKYAERPPMWGMPRPVGRGLA
jgi:hypothetical protein